MISLIAGLLAGSVALVGFGLDSVIEVTASGAAEWRLRSDLEPVRRARVEHVAVRVIGWTFIALATYVLLDGVKALWLREQPERSVVGIAILALSAVVMPVLARAKGRVARRLSSRALVADATQTSLCETGIAIPSSCHQSVRCPPPRRVACGGRRRPDDSAANKAYRASADHCRC